MHKSSMARMRWFVDNYILSTSGGGNLIKVLDVGSYNVNGSYRQLFPEEKFSYTGLDMQAGPNVDIVPQNAYVWKELVNNGYDIVISGQAFEHIEFFWLTALEMSRVLKPGGLMCVIAPRGFGRHRHPVDCYRFDADGMIAVARYCNLHVLHASSDMAPEGIEAGWHMPGCEDSMIVATKPFDWHGAINPENYALNVTDLEHVATGMKPCK